MENLSKEKVELISEKILNSGDVIAKCGTTIEKALNIMKDGLNVSRSVDEVKNEADATGSVYEICDNASSLYTNNLAETGSSLSANVIVEVSAQFIKDLLGYDNLQYREFIREIKSKDKADNLIQYVADIRVDDMNKNGIPSMSAYLPKEFVRGIFIYSDNNSLLTNVGNGVEHLSYMENENFYDNLSKEAKVDFILSMQSRMNMGTTDLKHKI